MIDIRRAFQATMEFVSNNKVAILTGFGVAGVVGTAFLAGKATLEADRKLAELKQKEARELTQKEIVKATYKYYIPVVAAGLGTIASILYAHHVNAKEIAAVWTVAKTAETALMENREGIRKVFGDKGLRKLDEELNNNHAAQYFSNVNSVYDTGHGNVLCCEGFLTGTLFRANREWIRKCVNDFNARLIDGEHLCYNDFIQMLIPNIDIEILPNAGYVFGYNLDVRRRMLEIVEDTFMINEPSDPGYIFNLRELPLLNYKEYY